MTTHQPDSEPILREDRLTYASFPRSVSLARRRSTRLVGEWGHPDIAGDVALLVSEMTSNALLHAAVPGRLFRVHLKLTEKALRIEVADARGERLPVRRNPGDDEQFGRGLTLVEALAARWGVTPCVVGKTVWAELDVA